MDGGSLPLGQRKGLRLRFHILVGDVDFCGGVCDFRAIGGIDGQALDVDVAIGVGGLGGTAAIAAGDLELDTLHLAVL